VTALVAAGFGDRLRALAGLDALVDVGRIDAASPALHLVRWLGSVVLVARPTLSDVLHTRELVGSLRAAGVRASLVLVGDRPYSPAEVIDTIGHAPLVGVLPDDPVGARALCGDAKSPKVLGRTRLVRAAGDLAARLAPAAPTAVPPPQTLTPPPAPPIAVPPPVPASPPAWYEQAQVTS
jgi:hypothetical protein